MVEKNKAEEEKNYSDEFIYDKYLFSVDKFDRLLTYASTGSIALLLGYYQKTHIEKYKCLLIGSLIAFLLIVAFSLISWYISSIISYKWVHETDKKDDGIDSWGIITEVINVVNIVLFLAAIIFAAVVILNN